MGIDVAAVDLALTTTRAVRLRLDLEREVDEQVILDCIDVAEQAPTGGNQSSRRWLVVRDPKLKAGLAELYLEAGGRAMIEARDRLAGSGSERERVVRSAAHLAEHLAEVPVIVIPTIIGRHDGSGRPGLFDSVLQAVWSFCVALRARGLGSAWTTVGLAREDAVAELLGIPDGVTPVAMLPVAWTKGSEFRRAPRPPARDITFFDGFGRTYRSGPGDAPRLADGPGTVVEVDVAAPPAAVWPLVTDLDLPARFSDEFLGAVLDDPTAGPVPGARFVGRNRHPARGEWEQVCYVEVAEEARSFGWCTVHPTTPGARWRFRLDPIGGGTRLRFDVVLGPGPSGLTEAITQLPGKEDRIIARRLAEHRRNMQRVVDGIRELAESAG